MRIINFFLFTVFCSASSCLACGIEDIKVMHDSPTLDKFGYVGSNMLKNGELDVIKKLIKSEDIVFDVGANVGKWSKKVLSHCGFVKIYAFEPVVSLYKSLVDNFDTENMHTYNIALSNFQGSETFYFYPKDTGKSGFYDREILRTMCKLQPEEITVEVDTLDIFCEKNNITHIDFLKIDTEGEEFRVLSGAYNLLKCNAIHAIQFEYGGCYIDSKTTLKSVYELLSELGYSVFRIVPKGLIKIVKWRDELENYRYTNYLAVLD